MESTLCSTFGAGPQQPGDYTYEFRRIKPDFLYLAPELKRRARDFVSAADVVHGHGLYVGTNFIFGSEVRRQDKPLVYHVHGFFEPWILNRSRWKKRLAHLLFEDENFRRARFWRALTVKEAEQIRQAGVKTPVEVVPNGVSVSDFPAPEDPAAALETPLIPNLQKTGPRLLFMSRLHPKKGLNMLIPVWARLGQARKDWQLVVAGPDEGGHLTQIRALAESLHIETEVHFTGAVRGSTRNTLLHSADLFVLPSYSEGFSMAILEAMACGVPVLATQNCNFPEITEHGAGWECDANLDSLCDTLRRALTATESERRQRGANGRQLVTRRYSWPVVIETLLSACATHC